MVENSRRIISNFTLNRVIWYLTLSDVFTWGIYLVINTFVGLYLERKFNGHALQYIGIGIAIYYFTKAVSQIPVGVIIDKVRSLKDDVLFLLLGNLFMAIPFFFYPSIQSPLAYYGLQIIFGLGAAMNLVSWRKTFARNLDEGKEGFSYAIYDTFMSLVMTVFGIVVGYLSDINQEFFDLVMISVGVMILSSGIWVYGIYRILILKRES